MIKLKTAIDNFDGGYTIMLSQRRNRIAIALIAVILLTACAHQKYYIYNDMKYRSPEKALAAQERDLTAVLNTMPPAPVSLNKTAIVILPSSSLIEENRISKRSHLSLEQIDYIVASFETSYIFMAKSIEKRHIFKSVQIMQNDNPEKTEFSEDVAVYLAMPEPGFTQWYVKKKNDLKATPVNADRGLPTPEQRTLSWIEDIEKAVGPPPTNIPAHGVLSL